MCEHHRAFVIYIRKYVQKREHARLHTHSHTHIYKHINRLACVMQRAPHITQYSSAKTTSRPKNFHQSDGETNENGKLSNVNEAMHVCVCVCV